MYFNILDGGKFLRMYDFDSWVSRPRVGFVHVCLSVPMVVCFYWRGEGEGGWKGIVADNQYTDCSYHNQHRHNQRTKKGMLQFKPKPIFRKHIKNSILIIVIIIAETPFLAE